MNSLSPLSKRQVDQSHELYFKMLLTCRHKKDKRHDKSDQGQGLGGSGRD